jgi:putative copper export protein
MLINEDYLGLGNFFGNSWSVLIVIKHVLVLAFLALAVFSERAFLAQISDEKPEALRQYRWALNIDTILGLIILLLTSIAQAG